MWIRLLALTFLLVLIANTPMAHADHEQELVGVYRCEGHNPDGEVYRGIVEIILTGHVLQLRWTMENGYVAYGMGLRDRKRLSVSYAGESVLGLVVYEIKGTTLRGRWTGPGATVTFSETLTKQKPGETLTPPPPPVSPHKLGGTSREVAG